VIKWPSFAKIMAALAVAFGIGMGLCGLSYVLPSTDDEFHTNWLSLPSILIMFLSFVGLIVALLIRVGTSAFGESSTPQKLFGSSDGKLNDKDQSL
jgi:hypothetical protein